MVKPDPNHQIDPQLYVRVLENVDRAIIAVDGAGCITLFNPTAQLYTGLSDRQSLGRHYQELFSGQQRLLYLVESAVRDGRSISNQEDIELQRPAAPPMPVSVSVSPIFADDGTADGAVLILRDLSRLRKLEEAERHADRLAMLTTMAAGLAHEIKNPLGGIKGAAQLLNMELPEASPLREYTQVMVKEVERVNGIIEELMDLARPRPPEISPVNLAKILNDIVLFQKEAHRRKKLHFALHLDPSIPPLQGDENLLTSLFLNLVKNAAEAIETEGQVDITTRVATEYHILQENKRPMPLIVVEIRDSGCGIPREGLDQIFTPFYTTKNRGTGLGLATCQKIVSQHGGFIKVDSQPETGTSFAVYLPFTR